MNRLEKIWNDREYQTYIKELAKLEKDRIFCRHDINHCLDVARIGHIIVLEKKLPIAKELLYVTSFLHDIGKGQQYKTGIPHEIAGAKLAQPLLEKYHFSSKEQEEIITAIKNHRAYNKQDNTLSAVLYQADKKSRTCFACPAESTCNWENEKKNTIQSMIL